MLKSLINPSLQIEYTCRKRIRKVIERMKYNETIEDMERIADTIVCIDFPCDYGYYSFPYFTTYREIIEETIHACLPSPKEQIGDVINTEAEDNELWKRYLFYLLSEHERIEENE